MERPEGAPWPVERSGHAACCLNYGEEHPQLLVTGGLDKNGKTLQDAWILDIKSGRWREVSSDESHHECVVQLLEFAARLWMIVYIDEYVDIKILHLSIQAMMFVTEFIKC